MTISGLFIIDPEGVVRQMSINDLPVGRSVDETLRLIKAFQFVEKHGEVRHWPHNGSQEESHNQEHWPLIGQ